MLPAQLLDRQPGIGLTQEAKRLLLDVSLHRLYDACPGLIGRWNGLLRILQAAHPPAHGPRRRLPEVQTQTVSQQPLDGSELDWAVALWGDCWRM